MKCRYAVSQLEIYLNREIPPAERRRLQAHLAICPDCRQELDELDALQSLIRASLRRLAARAFPTSGAWDRIQESIHANNFPLTSQPSRPGGALPGWQAPLFSNTWPAFCLPRGAWWLVN